MNQKIENLLNLAIESDEETVEKTPLLNSGIDLDTGLWKLIVKYSGDISYIDDFENTSVELLLNNFAVVTTTKENIEDIAMLPEIIFVEKPKDLYFGQLEESCISTVQSPFFEENSSGLFGNGTIMAYIDSGIEFTNSVFRKADGTTKVIELLDQKTGTIYDSVKIDEALQSEYPYDIVPVRDISGHGTHVAGIGCAIATQSELIVVKLENNDTANLMRAIDYTVKRAIYYTKPMAINISIGTTYGSHDGTSLLPRYIDLVSNNARVNIIIGSGNEGAGRGHVEGILNSEKIVELAVSDFEPSLTIQIWKNYSDEFELVLESPSGTTSAVINKSQTVNKYFFEDNTVARVIYGEPKPFSQFQEILINLVSLNDYILSGIWKIKFRPVEIVDGRYDIFLPAESTLNLQTGFFEPSPYVTLTIPSTASAAITVGAYNSNTLSYADFSGRGYTRVLNQVKPDIVAPGVDIISVSLRGGMEVRSGTSMATPFVTASAALLMEWGIVRNNDEYLYGEKLKAYLIKGARQLRGEPTPSRRTGWGALCLAQSIPRK